MCIYMCVHMHTHTHTRTQTHALPLSLSLPFSLSAPPHTHAHAHIYIDTHKTTHAHTSGLATLKSLIMHTKQCICATFVSPDVCDTIHVCDKTHV